MLSLFTQNILCQTHNVTFQVNMSNEASIASSISIAGNFQSAAGYPSDWSPGSTLLTDPNQDSVYSITVQIPAGSYEFKYLNGVAWGTDESVPGACQVNGNRALTVASDTTLDPICFGTCMICPACSPTFSTDAITTCDSHTWIDGNTYTVSNNTATHTLTNAAGCDSVVTLDLTINSVSDLTTSITGVTISSNSSGATYQWLDCDNNNSPIISETGQSFTATANGNYAVEITENGCTDTSACVAITTVGIIENSFVNELLMYPNPTTGNFSVDLGDNFNSIKVKLTDINGKLIQTTDYNNSQILNLNIVGPAGIYLLTIESAEQRAVIRLVKQ